MTETDIPPSPPKPAPQPKPAPPRPAPQPAPRPAPAPMPAAHPEPSGMPFSPENIRTTTLVVAIVLLVFIGAASGTAIAVFGDYNTTPTLVTVVGVSTVALTQILHILRSDSTAHKLATETRQTAKQVAAKVEEKHEEIKAEVSETKEQVRELARNTNGELVNVVKMVAEEARQAEREQMVADPACMEKLEEMARKVARETADAIVGKWRNGDPDRRKGHG